MFHVLLALVDGERHGYGIMQEVLARTGYRTIRQLVGLRMVVESNERPDPALDDERRRYYRITAAGRTAAESEARRLAQILAIARSKRLLPGEV